MVVQFVLFGFLGLLGELGFTSLKKTITQKSLELKGETSLWMFPVYGLIAFVFPLIAVHISSWPWIVRGLIYMVTFFLVEYIAGFILTKLKICPWKYPAKYSVNGLIYLPYAPLWFAVGLGIEWIYPWVVQVSRYI